MAAKHHRAAIGEVHYIPVPLVKGVVIHDHPRLRSIAGGVEILEEVVIKGEGHFGNIARCINFTDTPKWRLSQLGEMSGDDESAIGPRIETSDRVVELPALDEGAVRGEVIEHAMLLEGTILPVSAQVEFSR